MRKLLGDPLLHFVVLGAALFAAYRLTDAPGGGAENRVIITRGEVERLAAGFARTWLRPPDAGELRGLIEDAIQEEICYREALAMGLDRDDTIVRRRLRQKLEFITEDVAGLEPPDRDDLQAFLEAHPERFAADPRVSFHQLFVDRALHEDAGRTAAEWLLRLRDADPGTAGDGAAAGGGDAAPIGDPTLLPESFEEAPEREVEDLFGAEFVRGLARLEIGRWGGPVESVRGLHLVLVTGRAPAVPATLETARGAVEREWRAARRAAANAEIQRRLRAKYRVTVDLPGWEP